MNNKMKRSGKMVLAIVDGSNVFSPNSCKYVTKTEAIRKGYIYVEGNSCEEYWLNMMCGNYKGGNKVNN